MLFQTEADVYLFAYDSVDAIVQCAFDLWYPDWEAVYAEWNDKIDQNGWIDIEDPLQGCQHDAFLPIRVKGSNIGKPKWDSLEIFVNGQWKNYNS